jgi:hypothetical protein
MYGFSKDADEQDKNTVFKFFSVYYILTMINIPIKLRA